MVGDWINMHEHYLIDKSKISIIYMTFETEVWGAAKAKYLDDKFGKYHFEIDMLEGKTGETEKWTINYTYLTLKAMKLEL